MCLKQGQGLLSDCTWKAQLQTASDLPAVILIRVDKLLVLGMCRHRAVPADLYCGHRSLRHR